MTPRLTIAMIHIRPLQIDDYDRLIALMQQTPGISFRDADSRVGTERYLARNPGLSFMAFAGDQAVGCLMAGHDGRRAYLQHLVVAPAFRCQGIATALLEHCLAALLAEGIHKSHVDVLNTNTEGSVWWEKRGWQLRTDIRRYSLVRGAGANA